jgi:hypothetical protein
MVDFKVYCTDSYAEKESPYWKLTLDGRFQIGGDQTVNSSAIQ